MFARFAVVLLLAAGLGSGCGAGPQLRPDVVEWEQARPKSPQRSRAVVRREAPPDIKVQAAPLAPEQQQQSAPPPGAMGNRLDRALARFVAQRSGNQAVGGELPSPRQLAQWREAFEVMERALDQRPTPEDLGGLVRSRVTLEVEMDRDRGRHPDMPHELTVAYIEMVEKIDRRVRELRAVTDGNRYAGAMPDHEGALFLKWPLGYLVPSSPFGYRRDPINGQYRFHSGIDLSSSPETTVFATAPGVVVFAAWSGGYGKYVVIEHAYGVRTHYAHLGDIFVATGTVLEERVPIGNVGSTGRSTGPHLHYSVSLQGRYVDPTLYTNTPIAADGSLPES